MSVISLQKACNLNVEWLIISVTLTVLVWHLWRKLSNQKPHRWIGKDSKAIFCIAIYFALNWPCLKLFVPQQNFHNLIA